MWSRPIGITGDMATIRPKILWKALRGNKAPTCNRIWSKLRTVHRKVTHMLGDSQLLAELILTKTLGTKRYVYLNKFIFGSSDSVPILV